MQGKSQNDCPDLEFELSNEFASVRIRTVRGVNGSRLEVASPRLKTVTRLDPMALESLTWQPMETFSRFLETPFGPEG